MDYTQVKRVATANKLLPSATTSANPISAVGSVSMVQTPNGSTSPLNPFRVSLTSASGAAKNFIVGDPSGLLSNLKGGTNADPDSATVSVAAMKATFAYAPVAIKAINYEVTSSSTQFQQDFKYMIGDIDGSFKMENVLTSAAQRNTQNNAKLLTLEFTTPLILSWNKALFLTVADGEDVYLTFIPSAAANR